MLSIQTAKTYFIVFDFTRLGLEPTNMYTKMCLSCKNVSQIRWKNEAYSPWVRIKVTTFLWCALIALCPDQPFPFTLISFHTLVLGVHCYTSQQYTSLHATMIPMKDMFHTVQCYYLVHSKEGYVSHRPMLLFSTFQGRICFTLSNVTI